MKSANSLQRHPRRPRVQRLGIIGALIACTFYQLPASAKHNSDHPLSTEEWEEIMGKVALLESSAFFPSLLPVIMRNRDALQLTQEQLNHFYNWRKTHYVNMVNIMNTIIEKKVQFSIESLSPQTNDSHLLEFQEDIHRLQRELLEIRLTCRAIVMKTFTAEQWDNFEFIVANDPKLASLLSQSHTVIPDHSH